MRNRGISQEWLKVIACVTMFLDHAGAVLLPEYLWLRIVGRIAFPIYCFLLAEGVHYTQNPGKYCLRLSAGALLSEIPFDLALWGGLTLGRQSVMLTLLIGFLMAVTMKHTCWLSIRILLIIPFAWAAELLCTDYGGMGVTLIGLFALTRGVTGAPLIQAVGMAAIFWYMDSAMIRLGGFMIPIEMFALLSLIPILLYSGRKNTSDKNIQRAFYLFYPVHLAILYLVGRFT